MRNDGIKDMKFVGYSVMQNEIFHSYNPFKMSILFNEKSTGNTLVKVYYSASISLNKFTLLIILWLYYIDTIHCT